MTGFSRQTEGDRVQRQSPEPRSSPLIAGNTGPLLTAHARLHPHACAVLSARGQGGRRRAGLARVLLASAQPHPEVGSPSRLPALLLHVREGPGSDCSRYIGDLIVCISFLLLIPKELEAPGGIHHARWSVDGPRGWCAPDRHPRGPGHWIWGCHIGICVTPLCGTRSHEGVRPEPCRPLPSFPQRLGRIHSSEDHPSCHRVLTPSGTVLIIFAVSALYSIIVP